MSTNNTTNDITIDVSNIKFCPGPCNSKTHESKPFIKKNEYWFEFKPHTGGRYSCFSYPLSTNTLNLTNVRMCRSCNSRHLEFWDEDAYEDLKDDAKIILKKLNIDLSLYKKKHIILDEPAFNTSVLIEEIVGKEKAKKYNSEDEEYIDEYIQFIPPYDYDHHLEAGADIRD